MGLQNQNSLCHNNMKQTFSYAFQLDYYIVLQCDDAIRLCTQLLSQPALLTCTLQCLLQKLVYCKWNWNKQYCIQGLNKTNFLLLNFLPNNIKLDGNYNWTSSYYILFKVLAVLIRHLYKVSYLYYLFSTVASYW